MTRSLRAIELAVRLLIYCAVIVWVLPDFTPKRKRRKLL